MRADYDCDWARISAHRTRLSTKPFHCWRSALTECAVKWKIRELRNEWLKLSYNTNCQVTFTFPYKHFIFITETLAFIRVHSNIMTRSSLLTWVTFCVKTFRVPLHPYCDRSTNLRNSIKAKVSWTSLSHLQVSSRPKSTKLWMLNARILMMLTQVYSRNDS